MFTFVEWEQRDAKRIHLHTHLKPVYLISAHIPSNIFPQYETAKQLGALKHSIHH